jgi:plasmid maintenance system killer protein
MEPMEEFKLDLMHAARNLKDIRLSQTRDHLIWKRGEENWHVYWFADEWRTILIVKPNNYREIGGEYKDDHGLLYYLDGYNEFLRRVSSGEDL